MSQYGGIDYSKWDDLSVSDNASDGESSSSWDTDRMRNSPRIRSEIQAGLGIECLLQCRGVPYEKDSDGWFVVGMHKKIRVHPLDSSVFFYSSVIYEEDPLTYVPRPDQLCNPSNPEERYPWGLPAPPLGDDETYQELMPLKAMGTNATLLYDKEGLAPPNVQFIDCLIGRKEQHLSSDAVEASMKQIYVLRIELSKCEEDVWRRVKVPSGIALAKLHDQVLVPVMGWARGYHAYAFEDTQDGTVIGPPDKYGGYVDFMHIPIFYMKLMDDRDYPLAALLRKEGDIAYYTYDLGDNWEHRLVLEEILDAEEGEDVSLIAGGGACPPEDSNGLVGRGNWAYANFLSMYKKGKKKQKIRKAVKIVNNTSINYTKPWLGGPPIVFNPSQFDIDHHRAVLQTMIAGPSVKSKRMEFLFTEQEGKYRESMRGCSGCGNRLNTLRQCSRCKSVSYCSRECQLRDWPSHKAQCKKHGKDNAGSSKSNKNNKHVQSFYGSFNPA